MGLDYHLQNAFISLITPPGVFVLLFFATAIYAKKYKKFFLVTASIFYALSTYFVGNILVKPIETPYNTPLVEEKVDGVVVLGGGHYPGSANLAVGEGSFKRVVYAIMLSKKYDLPLIFAGADEELKAAKSTISELNHTLDLNLSNHSNDRIEDHFSIIYTKNSANTIQNAMRSIDFFKSAHIENPKIYLVTSATHMKRAKAVFEDFEFTVIPAATDFKTRSDSCYCFYYPSIEGLSLSYHAMHEALGSFRDYIKNLLF
jgi:uncharacterized SAM-binding protein YcdF (DUF218 family)